MMDKKVPFGRGPADGLTHNVLGVTHLCKAMAPKRRERSRFGKPWFSWGQVHRRTHIPARLKPSMSEAASCSSSSKESLPLSSSSAPATGVTLSEMAIGLPVGLDGAVRRGLRVRPLAVQRSFQ
jgi:hypothetical protein